MATPQLIAGLTSTRPPTAVADNQDTPRAVRVNRHGDLKVDSAWCGKQLLADEGGYFTAGVLPGATALQIGISAAYLATTATLVLENSAPAGGKRIYLDYIRFRIAVAGTSGTDLKYAVVLDNVKRRPTTLSSGASGTGPGTPATGTAYIAPAFGTNMADTTIPVGIPYFPLSQTDGGGAAPTVPAAGTQVRTIIGEGSLRAQIIVAKDDYTLTFGDPGFYTTTVPALTTAAKVVVGNPPVVIGPGQYFLLYTWSTSNATAGNAISALDMGWIEK